MLEPGGHRGIDTQLFAEPSVAAIPQPSYGLKLLRFKDHRQREGNRITAAQLEEEGKRGIRCHKCPPLLVWVHSCKTQIQPAHLSTEQHACEDSQISLGPETSTTEHPGAPAALNLAAKQDCRLSARVLRGLEKAVKGVSPPGSSGTFGISLEISWEPLGSKSQALRNGHPNTTLFTL